MKCLSVVWGVVLVAILMSAPAGAVDGFSVTTHWSGTYLNDSGGLGEIWRHDIEASELLAHTLIYESPSLPARCPSISPDGGRIALLLADGSLCVLPVEGGECVPLPGAVSHARAHIDWASGNWIYYNQGGREQPSGSRFLRRVDAVTLRDELVAEFKNDDGVESAGTWRVHVASHLDRALVRPDNSEPEPFGRITAYDLLLNDGILRLSRSTPRWRCSEGLSPTGAFVMAGLPEHQGIELRRFEDLSVISSILWEDTADWDEDDFVIGLVHNLNRWSANSEDWVNVSVGWPQESTSVWPKNGTNQMLVDWVNGVRIVVTRNQEGAGEFDDAGDFFVLDDGAEDRQPPQIAAIDATADPSVVDVTFSEPVEASSAASPWNYTIAPDIEVLGAALLEDGLIVRLTVSGVRSTDTYELSVSGVKDASMNHNPIAAGSRMAFQAGSGAQPFSVDAGPDGTTPVDIDFFLSGAVTGGIGSRTVSWSLVSGPKEAVFAIPQAASTFVRFSAQGEYVLRLSAEAQGASDADEVHILVTPPLSIEVVKPTAEDRLVVGATTKIEWTTVDVDDVRIDFSCDGGATWSTVATTVDVTAKEWQSWPWIVPDCVTDQGVLRLEEYSGAVAVDSELFVIVADDLALAPEESIDCSCRATGRPSAASLLSWLWTLLRQS